MNLSKFTEMYNFANGAAPLSPQVGMKYLAHMIRDPRTRVDASGAPYFSYVGNLRINYWPVQTISCGPRQVMKIPARDVKKLKVLIGMRAFCDLVRSK